MLTSMPHKNILRRAELAQIVCEANIAEGRQMESFEAVLLFSSRVSRPLGQG